MNQSLISSITMYPSPIPEIQGAEKSADMMAPGQFLYTTASSPQTSTLQPSPVAQIPQNIQQSFAGDAALGLQFQMSSESWSTIFLVMQKTKLYFVKCMHSVRRAIIKSSESMVHVG